MLFTVSPVSHISWNLLIYRPGATEQAGEPLGRLEAVTEAFNQASNGLEWESSTQATLPVEGGFGFELTMEDDMVKDAYTDGGYNHLRELAALCKCDRISCGSGLLKVVTFLDPHEAGQSI